jgi:endogenous inhibitor of DNA gyrase (YacG/DUF329 family)
VGELRTGLAAGLAALFVELHQLRAGICPACGQPLPRIATRARAFTCSEKCHAAWIEQVVARHGETKEIASFETGRVYLVPTRVILEHGISGADLPRFPLKGVPSITCPRCQRVSYNLNDIAQRLLRGVSSVP